MKRATIRVQLDSAAKAELDRLCETRGMTQIAVMSRTVRWLVAQDEVVQAGVLGTLTRDNLRVLSRHLLRDMAGDKD